MIQTGNGLFTNEELIDTLISDLNDLGKHIATQNTIGFCNTVVHMAQKLVNLKKGVSDDMKHKNETIEDLKNQLKLFNPELTEVTPEQFLNDLKKDGANNGAE